MNRGTWITGVLVSAMSITAVAALAQATPEAPPRDERAQIRFERIDADGNGQITMEELQAQHNLRFTEVDADGDGQVSAEEIIAQRAENRAERETRRAAQMIERMDANGDGLLSAEEMQGDRDPAEMFERVDADGNGTISAEEFAEMGKKMHRKGMRGDHGRAGKRPGDEG